MADTSQPQTWRLIPLEAVGPLRFGMTRDDVIEILGEPEQELSRDPVLFESHRDGDVQPMYNAEQQLIAVQLFEQPLQFRDVVLTDRHADEVRSDLERHGVSCSQDIEGDLVVAELGLHFDAPGSGPRAPIITAVVAGNAEYEALAQAIMQEEYGES